MNFTVPRDIYNRIKAVAGGVSSVRRATYFEARYVTWRGHEQEPFALDAPVIPEGAMITMSCSPWEPVSMDEGGTLWKRRCEVSW